LVSEKWDPCTICVWWRGECLWCLICSILKACTEGCL